MKDHGSHMRQSEAFDAVAFTSNSKHTSDKLDNISKHDLWMITHQTATPNQSRCLAKLHAPHAEGQWAGHESIA